MVERAAAMESGEFETTIYTSLFSSRTSTYCWNTYDDPAIRSASLEDHASRGTDLVVL